jgi:pimeloyl-ACP methyl ester carboxylesterase
LRIAEPARSPTSNQTPAGGWLAAVAELNDPIDPDSAFMRNWWKVSIAYNPEFARRQRRDAAAIPARVWRAIADQCLVGVDLRTMLPRVRASTLLIWGARDTLVQRGRPRGASFRNRASRRTGVRLARA